MKDIITVCGFTIKEFIKKKSFIFSTIVILIVIIAGFNMPNIMNSFNKQKSVQRIIMVDKNNIYEDNRVLNSIDNSYSFTIKDYGLKKVKKLIRKGSYDAGIIITEHDASVDLDYITVDGTYMEEVPSNIVTILTTCYTNKKINSLNMPDEEIKRVIPKFNLSIIDASNKKSSSNNVLLMMVVSFVLFFAIYFNALQVSSSITTEKNSKIIETLVTSTSPRKIILGKTLGIGIVGLFQLLLEIITALICANIFLDKELLTMLFDVSNISAFVLFITIVYFILGYFLFSFLYALVGSTVSKPEDVGLANTPISMISLIGFYLAYFSIMNADGNLNKIASFLPISSPFCMPIRTMMRLSTPQDMIISIGILALVIIIVARVAITIYSDAILNYGTKLSLKDIIKMYKNKN